MSDTLIQIVDRAITSLTEKPSVDTLRRIAAKTTVLPPDKMKRLFQIQKDAEKTIVDISANGREAAVAEFNHRHLSAKKEGDTAPPKALVCAEFEENRRVLKAHRQKLLAEAQPLCIEAATALKKKADELADNLIDEEKTAAIGIGVEFHPSLAILTLQEIASTVVQIASKPLLLNTTPKFRCPWLFPE